MEEKGHLDAIEGPQNCHQVIYLCWRYLSRKREREVKTIFGIKSAKKVSKDLKGKGPKRATR